MKRIAIIAVIAAGLSAGAGTEIANAAASPSVGTTTRNVATAQPVGVVVPVVAPMTGGTSAEFRAQSSVQRRPAWNPWRSACATAVTVGIFAIGYWALSRVAWVGTWVAGHWVAGGEIRQMLAWFSWDRVYSIAYNHVC